MKLSHPWAGNHVSRIFVSSSLTCNVVLWSGFGRMLRLMTDCDLKMIKLIHKPDYFQEHCNPFAQIVTQDLRKAFIFSSWSWQNVWLLQRRMRYHVSRLWSWSASSHCFDDEDGWRSDLLSAGLSLREVYGLHNPWLILSHVGWWTHEQFCCYGSEDDGENVADRMTCAHCSYSRHSGCLLLEAVWLEARLLSKRLRNILQAGLLLTATALERVKVVVWCLWQGKVVIETCVGREFCERWWT